MLAKVDLNKYSEIIVPVTDFIHAGVYSRTAYAKAGSLIVGCAHNKDGIAFLLEGEIKQVDGNIDYCISAPSIIKTSAGTQRMAYAVTDCVYSTIHSTDIKTTDEAEAKLFVGVPQITRIRNDFKSLLKELDITEAEIEQGRELLDNKEESSENYTIGESSIHGLGCYSLKEFTKDDPIALASLREVRYNIVRFINHSDNPNCGFVDYKDGVMLVALKEITDNTELLVNYRERIDICQQW